MQEELIHEINRVSRDIVAGLHLELIAAAEACDEGVRLVFSGRDENLLLQRNAGLLYALDYLINRMFFGRLSKDKKITADVADYRLLRQEELRLMALKASEKVMAYGQPVDLQPMPPNERRIIHLALKDQPKVRTISEGVGPGRKVIILPAPTSSE